MTQLSLLSAVETVEKPHKRVRTTSRAVYARQRDTDVQREADGKETREGRVLRCLAAWFNRYQYSPTAYELFHRMVKTGESVTDLNDVRPRLTSLCDKGLVRACKKRRCTVTKKTVLTWKVREAGDQQQ